MKKEELARCVDHTILGAEIKKEEVIKKCKEVKEFNFASLCTMPHYLEVVTKELKDSTSKVCTVVGFPFGNTTTESKVNETKDAINKGATEIDMVMNISAFKDKEFDFVENDISSVVKIAKNQKSDIIVKIIIETCYLSDSEIIKICKIINNTKVDFIKTSTGFGTSGAKVKDIKLIKNNITKGIEIKASGGIKSYNDALKMIEAGATRIGVSSGVEIIKGAN